MPRRGQNSTDLEYALAGLSLNTTTSSTEWPSLRRSYTTYYSDMIQQYYTSQRPSAIVTQAREAIIKRIQTLIRNQLPAGQRRSISVECYGGTAYGVDSSKSDLDLVILDNDRPDGLPPNVSVNPRHLPDVYDMHWLADLLERKGFTNVEPIPDASVPIVKFHDPRNSLDIDINCNSQLGLYNTWLIDGYCDIYGPLRPMIYFIKKWAAIRDLNDPSGRGPTEEISLSSYCYALMAVAYLQMRGVLPNLQRETALRRVESSEFWIKKGDWRIHCDTRIGRAPARFRAVDLSLGDALYGWFRYFGYDYDYGHDALSIQQGGVLDFDDLQGSTRHLSRYSGTWRIGSQAEDLKRSFLIVQDPFILSKNVSRFCKNHVIREFRDQCKFTASLMKKGEEVKTLLRTCRE
ncbi:hypothetical protein FRC03_006897 [Tulasnella sp. 419]|nr:hypothetical protein FRC03_006897 [Tulasnella sp. 419]